MSIHLLSVCLLFGTLNVSTLPQNAPRYLVNSRGCGQLCKGELAMGLYEHLRVDSSGIGTKFGEWTQIGASFVMRPASARTRYAVFQCSCGTIQVVRFTTLRHGETTRCNDCRMRLGTGGVSAKTHGKTHTPEFAVWGRMLRRCYNANSRDFKDYGAKGIGVCQEWRDSFEAFYSDMGPRPTLAHTIDRIESADDYGPSNCRWLLTNLQSSNRRCCYIVTIDGRTMGVPEWAKVSGEKPTTICSRLSRGWNHRDAVFGKS